MEKAPNLQTLKQKAGKINAAKEKTDNAKTGKLKNPKLLVIIKTLPWTPRLIGILSIIFISISALNSFDQDSTIIKQTGDFLIHLIHPLIFTAVLVIAWKRELIGGILFIVLGLIFSNFTFTQVFSSNRPFFPHINNILLINSPFIIVGILFILSHFKEKRKTE